VGVAKALIESASIMCRRTSATRAITTNWRPINAAPDDPTIT
jgi:hypothetical protein